MNIPEILKKADDTGIIPEMIDSVVELFKSAGEAATHDVRQIAASIGRDMIQAKLKDDSDWMEELVGQAKMLGEIERLRALGVSGEALAMVLSGAANLAARIAARFATGGII